MEELYEAAARSSFRDASGQPSVSKDYMTVFEIMARADGDEAPFNVERVFNGLTGAIEQVGLGAVPEWNTLWRTALAKSLKWKAAGRVERAALDEIMELLGAFSLSEATAQQIKSVYSKRSVFVAPVLPEGKLFHPQQSQTFVCLPAPAPPAPQGAQKKGKESAGLRRGGQSSGGAGFGMGAPGGGSGHVFFVERLTMAKCM